MACSRASGKQGNGVYFALAVLASLSLLPACSTVGPDFVKPEAPLAEEWGSADARLEPRDAEHRDWWRSFQDPTLNRLIDTAYQQNLSLQIAGLRILEARAVLGIAVGNQYPQVQEINASAVKSELSENNSPISSLPDAFKNQADTSVESYDVGFDAAWELDFWGRFRRGVEAADANLMASLADYDDLLVSLTAEVASTYILIRTLEERLAFARENVAIQKRSLEIADVRYRNGITTELDVQQAKALLRNTQALVPELAANLMRAKHGLSVLMGMPPGELQALLGGAGKIPALPGQVAVGLPADLLRRRPDIRRAELQAAAQSAQVGIAATDLYPHFSLVGSIGVSADRGSDLFDSDSGTGFIGPFFRWSIFNYGRIKNNVRLQDARLQSLLVNYRNTVLRAAQEVEDAQVDFLQGQEQVGFLDESVTASARAVQLSLVQYRDGAVDYTRVLDSQEFLLQQQDAFTARRGDVARSLIAMYKSLGGGWQLREGKPFISEQNQSQMRERSDWGELLTPEATQSEDRTDVSW